ncbi:hypothetical protein [Rhodococcus sp. NPDC057529]|uniref:hypothetical protein n=1 Tax=Rhodococcus sp. NPDC057529 TaxID=3346158 RepID=UPI003672C545
MPSRAFDAWQEQQHPNAKRRDIRYDSIEAAPDTDLLDDESRRAGLAAAYMDAPRSDLDRLEDDILNRRTTVADAIRFFLNGLAADAWVNPRKRDTLDAATWRSIGRSGRSFSRLLEARRRDGARRGASVRRLCVDARHVEELKSRDVKQMGAARRSRRRGAADVRSVPRRVGSAQTRRRRRMVKTKRCTRPTLSTAGTAISQSG